MAIKLDVHPTYISSIEKDLHNLSLKVIDKIASALKIKYEQLLKFEVMSKKIESLNVDIINTEERKATALSPEQLAAKERIIRELEAYINSDRDWSKQDHALFGIFRIQQEFDLNIGELSGDDIELKQKCKEALLVALRSTAFIGRSVRMINELNSCLHITDDIYIQKEFQEAVKEEIKKKLNSYLKFLDENDWQHADVTIDAINFYQQKFNIPIGELEADPKFWEKLKKLILKKLRSGHMEAFKRIRSHIFIQDDIYNSSEFQEAAKKGIIVKVKSCLDYFGSTTDKEWQVAMDMKHQFHIDNRSFEEISHAFVLDSLKIGNVSKIVKIQEVFSISNKKLLNSEYTVLAKRALVSNFEWGNRDAIEKIKEKFLPKLNTTEFIKNQYKGYINRRKLKLLFKLKSHFPECSPLFQEFVATQRKIARNNKLPYPERQQAFNVLAGLAENGEDSITEDFSSIIKQRSKQKIATKSKWTLDPIQEGAFYTLIHLDNSSSNEALFGLLDNDNVSIIVKYEVLKKLTREDRGFLDKKTKATLKDWLYTKSLKELDWQDLRFVKAILNNIPSTELRNKSKKQIHGAMEYFIKNKESINQEWQKKNNNIPENTFLQVWQLSRGDESLLNKFQTLYTTIRKENTAKDDLLYGIIQSLETNPGILKLLVDKLKQVDFSTKQDAETLSDLFRKVVFLDNIDKIGSRYEYNDEYYDEGNYEGDIEINADIEEIFAKDTKSLEELTDLLQEVATKKIQEILPHEDITAKKIERIQEKWGNLEPIFTYVGRYPGLKKYIAGMVTNFDSDENWKNWRYNLENKTVQKQIGHLSEEQLRVWQGEYFVELGNIIVAEGSLDKSQKINYHRPVGGMI